MHSRHHVPCLTALTLVAAVLALPAAAGAQSEGTPTCRQAATASQFGTSSGNFYYGPAMLSSAAPVIGTTPALQLSYMSPSPTNGVLMISLGAITTTFDCLVLHVDLGPTLGMLPLGLVPPGGAAYPIMIPNVPSSCTGVPIYFQMIVAQATNGQDTACLPLQATNGLQWIIGAAF